MAEHRGKFDHLFGATHNGARSWRAGLTTDEQVWFDGLVDAVIAWGIDPNWKLAREDFADTFGEHRACASTTLTLHVRAAVKERDGK
jgi:hypothetical protein